MRYRAPVSFLLGFVIAVLTLSAQAPDGSAVLHFAGSPAWREAMTYSAALATAGLLCALAPKLAHRDRPGGSLLLGLAAGGLLQALLLGARLSLPSSVIGLALWNAMAFGGSGFLLIRKRAEEPEDAPHGLGLIALLIGAAGATLALQGQLRLVLRLGLGSPLERDWAVCVGLLGALAGGLAFGRYLGGFKRDRARGLTPAMALAGAGLGAWIGARAAMLLVTPRGIRTFIRRFGGDLSESGTLSFGGITTLAFLLVPVFFVGTALYAARGRRARTCIALGAALAPLAGYWLLQRQGVVDLMHAGQGSTSLIHAGAWACVIAGALLLLPGSGAQLGGRIWTAGAGVATTAALLLASLPGIPVMLAWNRFPIDPVSMLELPEGQIIVVPDGSGALKATLDQREITTGRAGLASERVQVEKSMALLDANLRERGVRVLLVGQLDPQRAELLRDAGAVLLDRSAAWWRAMPVIERQLYGAPINIVPGEIRSTEDARERWKSGEYDLILAFARPGMSPAIERPQRIANTAVVLWLDSAAPLVDQHLGEHLLLAASGLRQLVLAVTDPVTAERAQSFASGYSRGYVLPVDRLMRREWERPDPERTMLLDRLAIWNTDHSTFLEALARLSAVQSHSSPFATLSQAIELDAGLVADLCASATEHAGDPLVHNVLVGLARVLMERRDIALLLKFIEPLSAAWGHPLDLEVTLAQADLESLDPSSSEARLAPFMRRSRVHPEVWRLRGDALYQLGRYAEAAELWRDLEPVTGLSEVYERRYALALLRSGSPLGIVLAKQILKEHPQDEELAAALEAGPSPLPEPEFTPPGDPDDH